MSRIPEVRLLFVDPECTRISAVQDTMGGRTFRCLRRRVPVGTVIAHRIQRQYGRDEHCASNFRILSHVHTNSVRAFLRSVGRGERLEPGIWHQVMED